jgi:hypothetical protein
VPVRELAGEAGGAVRLLPRLVKLVAFAVILRDHRLEQHFELDHVRVVAPLGELHESGR